MPNWMLLWCGLVGRLVGNGGLGLGAGSSGLAARGYVLDVSRKALHVDETRSG
ncbi:hypothetical protein [Humibacter antri]